MAATVFIASLSMACLFKSTHVQAAALPTKYDANLEFNAEKKLLVGQEEVNIKNNSGCSLKNLEFHLYPDSYNKKETMPLLQPFNKDIPLKDEEKGDISISKVVINGKEVQFTQDNELLKINLDNELKNTEDISVTIQFSLKLPKGTLRLGYFNDVYSFTNWYPILSMYDPQENKWDENSFNPIGESNYSDIAEYNINLKVPSNFVVASTGKEKEVSEENNTKVLNLSAKDVRDFVFIMSPYFKSISKEIDGIKVNSYYLEKDSESTLKTAENVLDSSVAAVKFFSQQFGKYPYDELDMVETSFQGGAMEYPQLVQMPKYLPDETNTKENPSFYIRPFIAEAAVHEVGHQWWYVTVGNNEFKEPFLDESMTAFSTAYFFDNTEGPYSNNGILSQLRSAYARESNGMLEQIKVPCAGSSVDKYDNMSSYNTSIYGKGALILEDLRSRIGGAKFKEVMQAYFKEYKFKNSSIDGFLSIIEQKCGASIKETIKNAIYSDNYNPENLKVTKDDMEKLSLERTKNRIQSIEESKGSVIGSLFLRAAKGEKITVVKPSSLSKAEEEFVNNNLQMYFTQLYPKISIKSDKDISENDLKNSNIMLLGNPWNNKLFDSVSKELPISLSKTGVSSSSFTLNNENTSGFLITKNPKNEKNLMGVLFWTKDTPASASIYPDMDSQFTITSDNKQSITGDF